MLHANDQRYAEIPSQWTMLLRYTAVLDFSAIVCNCIVFISSSKKVLDTTNIVIRSYVLYP